MIGQETPYIKHKSFCPRSRIQDFNSHGRFNFVRERIIKTSDELGELVDNHIENRTKVTPGPGQYEIMQQSKHTKLGLILGQHTIYNSVRQPMPGPGKYNPTIPKSVSNFKSTPSVVFSPPRLARFKADPKQQTPGPGQYKCEKAKSLLSNFSSASVYSISKTSRGTFQPKQGVPAPTTYNTDRYYNKSLQKPANKFKFVHGFPS